MVTAKALLSEKAFVLTLTWLSISRHIINFYRGVQSGEITSYTMRAYLEKESRLLAEADEEGSVG